MNVVGIIAEYNPFHNGHLYHLDESIRRTKSEYAVCIMSGNFLQRGEPALYDKWIRAETAVNNGVDLVLELPVAFACNSAEYFAYGAVSILDKLGCVTHLSFGSENGEMEKLYNTARLLASEEEKLQDYIKEAVSKGISFPKAREEAIGKFGGQTVSDVIKEPNNILGVEYLKALIRSKSRIQPVTIKRFRSNYNDKDIDGHIASATAIRNQIAEKGSINGVLNVIPKMTFETLQKYTETSCVDFSQFFELIMYEILSSSPSELASVFSVSEGLENRIIKSALTSQSIDELINAIKTKRYTQTRIQRALIHILLRFTKEKMESVINNSKYLYGRILGFSPKGAELIKFIKKRDCASIPVITNINKEVPDKSDIGHLLELDILASNIYNLVSHNGDIYSRSDFTVKPYALLRK